MTRLHKKNWLEWAVFALAALLLSAAIAYLVHATFEHEETPPDLAVMLGEPEAHGRGVRIPVYVYNTGGSVAQAVQIEVLVPDAGEVALARLELARVPPQAMRQGWVELDITPARAGRARVRILGYETR